MTSVCIIFGSMQDGWLQAGQRPVRSSPAPPHPDEGCREHRLRDDRTKDAWADASSQELEEAETCEQRDCSAHDQTHRRAKIRGVSRSSEEEHQGEAEIDCANPSKDDNRAWGRLDTPFLEHRTAGEDEAAAEQAAGAGHDERHHLKGHGRSSFDQVAGRKRLVSSEETMDDCARTIYALASTVYWRSSKDGSAVRCHLASGAETLSRRRLRGGRRMVDPLRSIRRDQMLCRDCGGLLARY